VTGNESPDAHDPDAPQGAPYSPEVLQRERLRRADRFMRGMIQAFFLAMLVGVLAYFGLLVGLVGPGFALP
jgi:hypothetical protein